MDWQSENHIQRGIAEFERRTSHLLGKAKLGAGVSITINNLGFISDLEIDSALLKDTEQLASVIMSAYAEARSNLRDVMYEELDMVNEEETYEVAFEPEF